MGKKVLLNRVGAAGAARQIAKIRTIKKVRKEAEKIQERFKKDMSILQQKQEHRLFQPKDPVYAELIDNLRLKIKHREGQKTGDIRAKKVECLHRFEQFNNVRAVTKFFSLYSLCKNQYLKDQATQRDCETSGERSCFLDKNGAIRMIVLHILKSDFRSYKFYAIASRLCLEIHIISSFKDPTLYIGVCFTRREGEQRKVQITSKAGGIMKKLFKVFSSVGTVGIL